MENPIIDAWRTHCRLDQLLVDAIPPEALPGVSASKGRSVGQIIVHIHNNRLNWLEPAAPNLMKGLAKIKRNQATDKALLLRALQSSGEAIELLLERSLQAGAR